VTHLSTWDVEPIVDTLLVKGVKVQGEGDHVVGQVFRDGLVDEHHLLHDLRPASHNMLAACHAGTDVYRSVGSGTLDCTCKEPSWHTD